MLSTCHQVCIYGRLGEAREREKKKNCRLQLPAKVCIYSLLHQDFELDRVANLNLEHVERRTTAAAPAAIGVCFFSLPNLCNKYECRVYTILAYTGYKQVSSSSSCDMNSKRTNNMYYAKSGGKK